MVKKSGGLLGIVMWIVGILVSLAVGFGMADGVLSIRWIPGIITVVAGWIVIVGTILGVIMAIAGSGK